MNQPLLGRFELLIEQGKMEEGHQQIHSSHVFLGLLIE